MTTYQEEQNQMYENLCRKYGKPHDYDRLTDEEKAKYTALKKLVRQEYIEAIRLEGG